MIIVSGGIKGGSGKTTLAANLAVMRALEGKDVLLVDADDQESATEFVALRSEVMNNDPGFTGIKLTGKAVRDQIQRQADKYDDIIIDTGGRDTVSQRAAISIADILLVPFAPRSLDVWTFDRVEALISEMLPANPNVQAFAFINRADHQGSQNSEAVEFLSDSETLQYIPTPLGNRKAFASSIAEGLGISEYKPRDSKAVGEMEALFNHIFNGALVS